MWVLLHLAGAILAWLVQFLFGWCSSCLVGAVETTAPPEKRQLHPWEMTTAPP